MATFDPTKYGAKRKSNSVVNSSVTTDNSTGEIKIEPNVNGATFPSKPTDTPLQSGLKAAGNLPSSAFNLVKNIGTAITSPVKTIKGLIGTGVGAVEKLIPGEQEQEKYANALGSFLSERYGGLDKLQKTATEDPVGFATDILTVVGGGASVLGKGAEVSKAVSTIAKPVTKTASGVSEVVGGLTKEAATGVAGMTTGVGKEAFKEALTQTPFTKPSGSMLDVVNQAREGFAKVKSQRSANYGQQLELIKNKYPDIVTTDSVLKKAQELIKPEKFNIKPLADGTFDLSRSPLIGNEKKVEAVFKTIDDWGSQTGDRTVLGIDQLKQQLRKFREPQNPQLNAFIDSLANSAKESIISSKNKALVDDYTKLESEYAKSSNFIDELQRTLSLGENSTPDTAITKLNSLLADNKDYRRFLATELEQATGKNIIGEVTKQQLSSLTPKGLAKYVGIGTGGLFTGGSALLPLFAMASPRIMGEFFRIIGATGRVVEPILSRINNFRLINNLKTVTAADIFGKDFDKSNK